jgi:peptide/nickel transport system substrate-binding protein
LRVATLLVFAATVTLACGGSSSPTKLTGGKAVWAEPPNATPNYIFPLTSGGYFSVSNLSQFQFLMYRPLYWFGENGTVKLNSSLSLAQDPVYSNGGTTVTIKLKGWKWSDGTMITSRDVEFWMNLLKANKAHWAAYVPGGFPDNVVSASYPDDMTAIFTLDKKYGSYFYTYNELSQISPLPQHVWDKTSASGSVGDFDRTSEADGQAVYNFLDGESKKIDQYTTSPLWQVVDGPWKLKSMTSDGAVAMVPNLGYSGPVKPTLAEFDEVPEATDTAEFNVLRSGGVDYGYIPIQDADQRASLSKYAFSPWIGWSINYIQENFNNADHGAVYKQLYFRQAMQHLIDQDGYIKNIDKGFGYPDYGPVPIKPDNSFADSFEKTNPYPFDVSAASKLLSDNGWTVNPGGVSVCTNPGTGAGQCGDGVKAGQKADFKAMYATGVKVQEDEFKAMASDFSKAGIKLTLTGAPFNTVITDAFGGTPTADIDFWGGGWIFAPDYYPTGDEIFSTGAGSNGGAYTNATNDANTVATTTSDDVQAMYTYEDFLAKDLPVMWFPVQPSQLSMVKKTLHGWDPQDALLQLNPETWYFTAS